MPAAAAPAAETVACDQAVFTSVRSGTGEGYRVIAASPGMQAHEKVEITRRSPSHGALCEEDPQTVGLEGYKLPTGRYCVAWCGYAGQEHTARGGQRVYTHAVLLDRSTWRQFQANPVAVHAALAQHIEANGPVLKPANRLEKITLGLPKPATNMSILADPSAAPSHAIDSALAAAADLLAGRSLVLTEAFGGFRLLEKILLSLPLETRESLSVSVGVRFSPSRKIRLAIVSEAQGDLQRRAAGQPTQVCQADRIAQDRQPLFQGWEQLLRRWWREGRRQDIQYLTTDLCHGVSCDALDRIAGICEQIDALDGLSADAVRGAIALYERARPTTKPEQVLTEQLLSNAQARLTALEASGDQ